MTMVHAIEHELAYRYDRPVSGSVMTLFLAPRSDRRQALRDFALETDPPGPVSEFVDPWGNRGHMFDRHGPHGQLLIRARSVVEVRGSAEPADGAEPAGGAEPADGADPDARESAGPGRTALDESLMLRTSRFVRPSSPALAAFISANGIPRAEGTAEGLRDLQSRLYEIFRYTPGSTGADSPIDRILETGRGVCQDYAHVMASICRRWGIPARYVSGYLAPAAGNTTRGESHAWVECRLPRLGWTGFDPANNCPCDERHVRVAVGRDYADVPPSRGVFSGLAASRLTTRVTITTREAERNSDVHREHHNNTPSRSTRPCKPASNPSPSEPSSGSRPSSQQRASPRPRADSPVRSAPMSSAATCGAVPTSESRCRSSRR